MTVAGSELADMQKIEKHEAHTLINNPNPQLVNIDQYPITSITQLLMQGLAQNLVAITIFHCLFSIFQTAAVIKVLIECPRSMNDMVVRLVVTQ